MCIAKLLCLLHRDKNFRRKSQYLGHPANSIQHHLFLNSFNSTELLVPIVLLYFTFLQSTFLQVLSGRQHNSSLESLLVYSRWHSGKYAQRNPAKWSKGYESDNWHPPICSAKIQKKSIRISQKVKHSSWDPGPIGAEFDLQTRTNFSSTM